MAPLTVPGRNTILISAAHPAKTSATGVADVRRWPAANRAGLLFGLAARLELVFLRVVRLCLGRDTLGVNGPALVAGLGIGGIAIGLAAQGIFSDLFAALAILFDKPFKRGDTILYDGSTGTVERIGVKTARLRSITGEQLIMA